jgi:hypothetical protein
MTMSEDLLRANVGYPRIDVLKRNMNTLYQPTVSLTTLLLMLF